MKGRDANTSCAASASRDKTDMIATSLFSRIESSARSFDGDVKGDCVAGVSLMITIDCTNLL